ncbi:MAG: general stress protein [Chloroflexota bacterium]|nr:general stress protein [Chloroflexota bacterium]
MITRREVAIGVFENPEDARDAIGELKDAGFSGNDISVLMPDRGQAREMAAETGTHAGTGAATGLVAGGILGGLAGWLVGIGALAIPGVGPFIAAGAFATALGGAVVGAGVGAIAGALVGMGIPEDEAKYYEDEVRGGRTLVTVRTGSRKDEADALLHRYGAYDIEHRDQSAVAGRSSVSTSLSDATPVRPAEVDRTGVTATSSTNAGGATGNWDEYAPAYRSRWEQGGTSTGGQWPDYEPRYRYGWEARNDPRYHDRTWTDAEPELRRDWEVRYRDRPWDDVREDVRDAWENVTGPARRSV